MKTELKQRGRAELNFVADVGLVGGLLRRVARKDLEARGMNAQTLAADLDERHAQAEAALEDSRAYQNYLMLHRWGLHNLTRAAVDAFDDVRARADDDLFPSRAERLAFALVATAAPCDAGDEE